MHLLRLLADGKFHSGEQLGAQLGIGRAAVWKRVAALRNRGLEIEVVPRKGYRLRTPLEPISTESVLSRVRPEILSQISLLRAYECVTSTNDVVAEQMLGTGSTGVVCLAEEQTEGRGRRGRRWISPIGSNLYCSIGWSFPSGIAQVEGLSLAVGVAVIRALHRYGAEDIGLKWPNDLLIGGAKLGGILVELHAEMGGLCRVIVGLGLNLALSQEVKDAVDRPVADLSSHMGCAIERNIVAALVIEDVLALLMSYPETGFRSLREEWCSYDVLAGAEVEVDGAERELRGIARGVNERGGLILETSEGERLIYGGEVSLRGRAG